MLQSLKNIKRSGQKLMIFLLYKIASLLIEDTFLLLTHFHCYLPGNANTFHLCLSIQACN